MMYNDYSTMKNALKYYIDSIYKHENMFLNEFFREVSSDLDLVEVYFSSERVRIVVKDNITGNQIKITLPIMDVCEWVDHITHNEKFVNGKI